MVVTAAKTGIAFSRPAVADRGVRLPSIRHDLVTLTTINWNKDADGLALLIILDHCTPTCLLDNDNVRYATLLSICHNQAYLDGILYGERCRRIRTTRHEQTRYASWSLRLESSTLQGGTVEQVLERRPVDSTSVYWSLMVQSCK